MMGMPFYLQIFRKMKQSNYEYWNYWRGAYRAKKMASTIYFLDGFTNFAIASRSSKKAESFKKKFGFKKAYSSYEELLKDEEVDLVYVATPHSFHYEHMELRFKKIFPNLC